MDTMCTIFTAGLIGSTIISTIISTTCQKSYEIAGKIMKSPLASFDDVKDIISSNDLFSKLNRIKNCISDAEIIFNNSKNFGNSLDVSMNDINKIILEINDLLTEIKDKNEYQDTLYFGTWFFRKIDCTALLNNLKNKINILNMRFDDFFKIVSILKI